MTDNELKELVAGLAVSQAKTDAQMARTEDQMAKTNEKFDRLETQMSKSIESYDRMGISLGNLTNNTGLIAEEYFFNSISANPYLGGIKYDKVKRNIGGNLPKVEDEFDIVLYNGNSIALIECKSKAHEKDLTKLITKKADNFRKLFPYYKNYKIYLGIASFSFYPELEDMAKQNGVAILKQKGDIVEIEATNLKAY